MGCTTMFVIALLGLALILGGTWWLLTKVMNDYTAKSPAMVEMAAVSDADYAAANQKFMAVQDAQRRHQSVTVQFTAPELNALIARHPEFSDMRGKFRVAIADSLMTLEMSVPLREIDIPGIRDRWLNGTARFEFIYHDDAFNFGLRSLTANNRDLPLSFLQGFEAPFNKSFNEGFEKGRRENARSNEFWENVKTVAVIDDKLVITTKGPNAPATPETAAPEATTPDADTDDADDEAEPTPTPEMTISTVS